MLTRVHRAPCHVAAAAALLLLGALLPQPVVAEVTGIEAEVTVALTRIDGGTSGTPDEDSAAYADPNDVLPLQVLVRDVDPTLESAAVVAAQFADPRVNGTIDPNEFALDLSLNTLTEQMRYAASATLVETRSLQFSLAELASLPGQTIALDGQILLDGVLAVFADDDVTDLTGNRVLLSVLVEQLDGAGEATTLFDEALELTGDPNMAVSFTATSGFPTAGIFAQDLADIDPDLGVFEALVFPVLVIPFEYTAQAGEPLQLRVTIEIEAENAGEASGVAALLGTPLDSLADVIGATGGTDLAQKMTTALALERAAPTGKPAFQADESPGPLFGFLPACGLLGFELLLAPLLIVGFRVGRRAGSALGE